MMVVMQWATKTCNRKRWLEVGTGADAVLTLMVLQGDSKVKVLGIEVRARCIQASVCVRGGLDAAYDL